MTNYIKEYMKDNNIQFGQKCYLIDDSEGTIIGENCYLDIIPDTGYIELHNPLFEDDKDMSMAILLLILQGLIEMVPMDRIKIEDKKIYIEDDIHHQFEVVAKWPQNYLIWNIGYDVIPGYVPFCQLDSYQPFPGGRNVNVNTLKAYKTDAYKEIMIAASGSCSFTLEDMKKYLKRCEKKKKLSSWDKKYIPKVERVVEEIERILKKEKTR